MACLQTEVDCVPGSRTKTRGDWEDRKEWGMGNRESPCCKCTARGCQAEARQKGVGNKFP